MLAAVRAAVLAAVLAAVRVESPVLSEREKEIH